MKNQTNEELTLEEIIREEIVAVLEEKKKRKKRKLTAKPSSETSLRDWFGSCLHVVWRFCHLFGQILLEQPGFGGSHRWLCNCLIWFAHDGSHPDSLAAAGISHGYG